MATSRRRQSRKLKQIGLGCEDGSGIREIDEKGRVCLVEWKELNEGFNSSESTISSNTQCHMRPEVPDGYVQVVADEDFENWKKREAVDDVIVVDGVVDGTVSQGWENGGKPGKRIRIGEEMDM